MATVEDIRSWALARGMEVPGKGIPRAVREAYDAEQLSTDSDFSMSNVDSLDDVAEERAPSIKEPGALEKARGFTDRVKRAGTRVRKSPKPRKPRVSVDRFISRVWQYAAQAVQPISTPTARVLDVQAPVAGLVLEDVIKGTVVDRVLQPLARTEAAGEVVFALVGPPLIVGAIHSRPMAAPFLLPLLKEALRSWVDVAGDKIQVAKERDEKFEKEYGRKIDEMIEYFFQDMMVEPVQATVDNA